MEGCEKIFGSLMGVVVSIFGIVGFFSDGLGSGFAWFFFLQGIFFAILNWILDYDSFISFVDSFTTSEFSAVILKWTIVAFISAIPAWIIPAMFGAH